MTEPTAEGARLAACREDSAPWKLWGPYLSERQWGTVREDYSANGDAWAYFPHEHAHARAYLWGEDGIAGISDDNQLLCFALALWNGRDPILKERLFGLSNAEGNHGEDIKEYAFYLENLPTHAYQKYLYKYPQARFPYEELRAENGRRDQGDFEYELLDTGVFAEDRYFDVFVEYAKEDPWTTCVRITAANRGPEEAALDLLPTLWCRNTWRGVGAGGGTPVLHRDRGHGRTVRARHPFLEDEYVLQAADRSELLFTENETNTARLFGGENATEFTKDGFHRFLTEGDGGAVSPHGRGTKATFLHRLTLPAGGEKTIRLRLGREPVTAAEIAGRVDRTCAERSAEADAFFAAVTPAGLDEDLQRIQRQAYSGLLWNKQVYHYNIRRWLRGEPATREPPPERASIRNDRWKHFNARQVMSMPDKWEYPWFAAWDLAFHTVPLARIDPDFAKQQLLLLCQEWFLHPNGQMPAYEWNFGDVNPPVHAWAAFRVADIDRKQTGRLDRLFLERIFHKLSLNFTWWVNREDSGDRNIFEGGFLGMDNIQAFDRDRLPAGARLEQVDGSGWVAFYALGLLRIALELAREDEAYEDMATKYFEHFVYIADAMNDVAGQEDGLWDEERGAYFSLLHLPDGSTHRIDLPSLVEVVPLLAVTSRVPDLRTMFPSFKERAESFAHTFPELLGELIFPQEDESDHHLVGLVSPGKLQRLLGRLLDPDELLGEYGLRSVARRLADEPYRIEIDGTTYQLDYEPAESTSRLFGGNSNWRGPVWFPLNALFLDALRRYEDHLGSDFRIPYPPADGGTASLAEVNRDLSLRLIRIFRRGPDGRRPVYGGLEKFQADPHWRDYLHFHEYFHGDNGAGLGASNQTGWTALVTELIHHHADSLRSPETGAGP